MWYPLFIVSYMVTQCPVLKGLPCWFLFMITNNPAFIFAGFGDYFLETDCFLAGVVSFTICNLFLGPEIIHMFENINLAWIFIILSLQLGFIHLFSLYFIFVDIYLASLLNLLAGPNKLAAMLFVISDIFVLSQFAGYSSSFISLPLYWTAMWLYSKNN
uniref:Uncharacterized protein n=1 Tax=viral metagenome TaxID=1070528 RepID=A0A6C0JVA6_9ZZZZ